MVSLVNSIPGRYATPSPGFSLRRTPFLAPSLRLLTLRLKTFKPLPSARISCESPVLAEGRARGVPLLRVPWGRSEGARQLHPVARQCGDDPRHHERAKTITTHDVRKHPTDS